MHSRLVSASAQRHVKRDSRVNSTILNVYNPVTVRSVAEEAQPWEGLYWTAGTLSGTKSPAFHFWFEKKTTGGGLENNVPYARANGMSVRCVRVQ